MVSKDVINGVVEITVVFVIQVVKEEVQLVADVIDDVSGISDQCLKRCVDATLHGCNDSDMKPFTKRNIFNDYE